MTDEDLKITMIALVVRSWRFRLIVGLIYLQKNLNAQWGAAS